ncbi:cytochrome P450 [Hyphomonas johnsonii]|uniref:Camphor 5-monooxygenase n=1 Tax=Hyphomonas johnsonii MHS-2 TaxID=1280950 RepID=A0A059FUR3_9PROT|nr:cytochrome P450 [Hyphomonas johnsonii]KCZ94251.1 camphor 5-monooxygenase [Hyphomonas johnsonii MHS-2]
MHDDPQRSGNWTVPDHVPADLVRFLDFRTGLGPCPHAQISEFHKGPPVFYSPLSHQDRGGEGRGAWVLTKAEDIRKMLQNANLFSSAEPRSYAMGESWKLIPLELDPPEHGKFRAPINPLLSPKRVAALEPRMREIAAKLIDQIKNDHECEFIATFGEQMPVRVFLEMMGMADDELAKFRDWADMIVHDRARRGQAMSEVKVFLQEQIAEHRANPREGTLVTEVLSFKAGDKPFSDEEVLGTVFLLFIGGLDTVVSSLSFHFRYLAENPDEQRRLREDPSLLPDAVEELFRAFPVVTTGRILSEDTDMFGVQMKKGDMVAGSTLLSTSDPDEFENPEIIDLARSPNRHNAFSFGPHRCLGSHLARREVQVAIDEWLKRMPEFRVKPGTEFETLGGGVMGMRELPLVW